MIELTDETFDDHLTNMVALVDFWAPWCQPCLRMAPILEDFADEYSAISVAKINVDDYPEVAKKYGVQSLPTLIIFILGEPDSSVVGAKSLQQLRELLGKYNG